MVTPRQRQSNKNNAALSTGPKTPDGKAVASRNALKYGLLSRELILPGEDGVEFRELMDALTTELRPQGTLEFALLERIGIAIWRQRRLVRAERAQIWARQSGFTNEGKPGARDSHTLPEEELIHMAAQRHRRAGTLDQLEQEFKLLHTGKDLHFAELAEQFPLVAACYPPPRSGLFATETTFAQAYGDRETEEVTSLQSMWLLGIAKFRQGVDVLDAHWDGQGIPEAADTLARYQAALDNEWYKAMRAFREAQGYRLRALEAFVEKGNKEDAPRLHGVYDNGIVAGLQWH